MKISVIIPIYNAEKHLHFCVDSIINQTYKDFEIILVNDGSRDNSPALCDKYAEKHNFIKVFHKENGGQSSARNLGIKKAVGDYILLADSDDMLHPQCLEILAAAAEKYDCDTVVFKEKNYKNRDSIKPLHITEPKISFLNTEECVRKELAELRKEKFIRAFHTKFIKRALYENRMFKETLFDEEDTVLSVQMCFPPRNIVYAEEILYFYIENNSSVTRNRDNFYRNLDSLFLSKKYIIQILEENNCRYTDKIISNFLLILIKDMKKCNREVPEFKRLKKDICEFFDRYSTDNLYTKKIYRYFKENNYRKTYLLCGNSIFSIFRIYRKKGF